MAIPSTVFTEMVSTTMRNVASDMADNLSANNALLRRLKDKNNFRNLDGGYEIQIPIEYAGNSNIQRFSGYDTQTIDASDNFTSAKYDWRQIGVFVTSSGRELRNNSGEAQMINLVKAKKKNALTTGANFFSVDMYSDGSLPEQINGLANLIQTNGQGTVGGKRH